jgi:lysyl-tRNA synthetase class 2
LTYDTAFERFVGTRVLELNAAELIRLAKEKELLIPASLPHDDRDGLLNFLLAELVEPNLGIGLPCFVYDYPATQAALAKIREDVPPVAERFELYWQGVELCNGYHELTDPDELIRRSIQQSRIRDARQAQPLPMQNRLLSAMRAGLPPCAGVALGFDRLLMLCIGASSLADVMAFPIDRA